MGDIKYNYPEGFLAPITLANLPSDTNLLVGRESTAIDNSGNKYLDYLVSGKIRVNTSLPSTWGRTIQIFAIGACDGVTWPDVLTGADSEIALSSITHKNTICRFVAELIIDATVGATYWFSAISIAAIFGGIVPIKFQLFIVQNTGQDLSSMSEDHAIYIQPVFKTIT